MCLRVLSKRHIGDTGSCSRISFYLVSGTSTTGSNNRLICYWPCTKFIPVQWQINGIRWRTLWVLGFSTFCVPRFFIIDICTRNKEVFTSRFNTTSSSSSLFFVDSNSTNVITYAPWNMHHGICTIECSCEVTWTWISEVFFLHNKIIGTTVEWSTIVVCGFVMIQFVFCFLLLWLP
jgi:hypothetical protein